MADDPHITSDFLVPENSKAINSSFFTLTAMRTLFKPNPPATFSVTKATMAEFPALKGQSVSYAALEFPAGGSVDPLHAHPRSAELLFVVHGCVEVGFVDTRGKLLTQKVEEGDMFLFPKGVVHFEYNIEEEIPAFAVSAFGSASPGTEWVDGGLFGAEVEDEILAKSFQTDVATIQKIKRGLEAKK
ncbi:germin-like protein 9-3 [Carica papaya]|uniref:germin-like protein 9-3 n=1 Tax=Carica papaya TaxID=3649 RepID=UPI000B8CD130|nr:germin-like protein 9-3 [Carica papaya]